MAPPVSDSAVPTDAGPLLAEARKQQVRGLLQRWAESHPDHPLGAALHAPLAESRQRNTPYALRLVAETARLADALAKAAVPAIVLKGAALSQRYYGDHAVREPGDIDLMVQDDAAVQADRLLRELGYRRTKPRDELSPARLALYLRTQHEFGYANAADSISVELHWRYADCPALQPTPFAELLGRAESLRIGASQIRVLSPADTFLQLAIHGAMDGWWRLKWIADLPRVRAAITDADMARLADLAARTGLERVLELARLLSGDASLHSAPWAAVALDYVAWRLQNPHPRELPTGTRLSHSFASRRYMHALFEQKSLRKMGYTDLIVPTDFDRVSLPDVLTPALPYVARIHRGLRLLLGNPR